MSDPADPLPVAQFDAQKLGRRFPTRRRWIGLTLVLGGIALVFGGFAGFNIYGDRADALQETRPHHGDGHRHRRHDPEASPI
ncbi:MAG: hypothetical protein QOG85_1832 [Gaiellaceae bacterium]|jgi:hypothetical protein|nr:hypothetical protein [Gaiellaceae bacterium]